jgi:hypothetical protein
MRLLNGLAPTARTVVVLAIGATSLPSQPADTNGDPLPASVRDVSAHRLDPDNPDGGTVGVKFKATIRNDRRVNLDWF